jgi:hypothetical protein
MWTLYVHHSGSSLALHLPTDMEAMKRFQIVHIFGCVVPKGIIPFQNLMELTIDGLQNSSSADLIGLENIPNLKKMHLMHNTNLNFIEFPNEFGKPRAFPKLEELSKASFVYLRNIP